MRVLIVATKGMATHCLINKLAADHEVQVVFEKPRSKKAILTWRLKKLGLVPVVGQLLFQLLMVPLLKLQSKNRVEEIITTYQLSWSPPADITTFDSVNSDAFRTYLQSNSFDLIVVNGTRIISAKTLEAKDVPWINIHAGITPQYRGVHGGYWALVNKDAANFGVTIHLIDRGVDTGQVLHQSVLTPHTHDNFYTYPCLQMSEGITQLSSVLAEFEPTNVFQPLAEKDVDSRQWFHPTLWGYVWKRITLGVR